MADNLHGDGEAVSFHDVEFVRGAGGETHQVAGPGDQRLTTHQGTPVSDDQNTLRLGERGPALLEDFHLREKIFHFDHERIPERVVHARGFAASPRRAASGWPPTANWPDRPRRCSTPSA